MPNEFTRFVNRLPAELVAIPLPGDTTADSAPDQWPPPRYTWVFKRIRLEYRMVDLTRVSKWDAPRTPSARCRRPRPG
jgi:hypothetical protein